LDPVKPQRITGSVTKQGLNSSIKVIAVRARG